MITLHAKPGAERELQLVLERHWATVRRMRLSGSAAHVTIRVIEDGNKVAFIHVFTWRNSKIPDSAPPAIQKIWADMNALVEARGGHPGLEIATVSMVRP